MYQSDANQASDAIHVSQGKTSQCPTNLSSKNLMAGISLPVSSLQRPQTGNCALRILKPELWQSFFFKPVKPVWGFPRHSLQTHHKPQSKSARHKLKGSLAWFHSINALIFVLRTMISTFTSLLGGWVFCFALVFVLFFFKEKRHLTSHKLGSSLANNPSACEKIICYY